MSLSSSFCLREPPTPHISLPTAHPIIHPLAPLPPPLHFTFPRRHPPRPNTPISPHHPLPRCADPALAIRREGQLCAAGMSPVEGPLCFAVADYEDAGGHYLFGGDTLGGEERRGGSKVAEELCETSRRYLEKEKKDMSPFRGME